MKKFNMVWVTIALILSIVILSICTYLGLSDSKIIATVALLGITLTLIKLFLDSSGRDEAK